MPSLKKAFLLTFLVFALPLVAAAQTPDFLTPSVETVCDGLSGAQFGLCNAYCEAMDCHLENPQASAQACAKVLSNFQSKSGGSNPPCDSPEDPCPCTNNEDFDQLVNGGTTILSCTQSTAGATEVTSITTLGGLVVGATEVGPPLQCGVLTDLGTMLTTEINQEQFDACTALLQEAATLQGVTCSSGPGPI